MLVSSASDARSRRVDTLEGKPIHGGALFVKALMEGQEMALLEIHYAAGVSTPLHAHAHESVVYVLRGKLKATIDGNVSVIGPGDVCRHPNGVLHGLEALEDSVILECKSPAPDLSAFMS
jgi:quercetin dioxygenase-like cupin family protein